ncbi:hypothetical protein PR048_008255 [Dryococelus australis]|uniref:Uncharacterized protein n=1 Tax=Dryococelus australis TaxID=614101 RepID=A0ABQ9HWK6_9NEOP|nr:hypothetical protein PR048_008255 [Dryococelus australis]
MNPNCDHCHRAPIALIESRFSPKRHTPSKSPCLFTFLGSRLLASHHGEPRSTPCRIWESCRTMPLVAGFYQGSPVSPVLSFRRCSIPSSALNITLLRAAQMSSLTHALFLFSRLSGVEWIGEIWAALNNMVLRVDEGEVSRPWSSAGMQRRRRREILRENPLTSGIVLHDSNGRKLRSDPTGNLSRYHLGGRRVAWPLHHRGPVSSNKEMPLEDQLRRLQTITLKSPDVASAGMDFFANVVVSRRCVTCLLGIGAAQRSAAQRCGNAQLRGVDYSKSATVAGYGLEGRAKCHQVLNLRVSMIFRSSVAGAPATVHGRGVCGALACRRTHELQGAPRPRTTHLIQYSGGPQGAGGPRTVSDAELTDAAPRSASSLHLRAQPAFFSQSFFSRHRRHAIFTRREARGERSDQREENLRMTEHEQLQRSDTPCPCSKTDLIILLIIRQNFVVYFRTNPCASGTHQLCNFFELAVSCPLITPFFTFFFGAAVAERLTCSPPTNENRIQSPAWSFPDFRMWEPCRTMPLVCRFSRGSPVSPALSFLHCSLLTLITLIDSQDLAVKRRPNIFTQSLFWYLNFPAQ